MNAASLSACLDCAVAAARAAGDHAMSNLGRRRETTQFFAHDVKLVLDVECQQKAESIIRTRFPDHGFLGEEGGDAEVGAGPLWVIDPIDGTVNFSHGVPYWCCSVALRQADSTLVGVVYAPAMNELFTATRDHSSACNGTPIKVSDRTLLSESLVLTGMTKDIETNPEAFDLYRDVTQQAQKVRIMGAAALDICYVAAGRAEAFFERGIYLWDVAAADLVVTQAGGKTAFLERYEAHRLRYLCANACVFDPLRSLVASAR